MKLILANCFNLWYSKCGDSHSRRTYTGREADIRHSIYGAFGPYRVDTRQVEKGLIDMTSKEDVQRVKGVTASLAEEGAEPSGALAELIAALMGVQTNDMDLGDKAELVITSDALDLPPVRFSFLLCATHKLLELAIEVYKGDSLALVFEPDGIKVYRNAPKDGAEGDK